MAITASVLQHQRKLIADSGADGFISKPFRDEELFECIEELLRVEFEYDDEITADEEKSKSPEIDLSETSISEDLYVSLKSAAELYQITELEKYLKELKNESGD